MVPDRDQRDRSENKDVRYAGTRRIPLNTAAMIHDDQTAVRPSDLPGCSADGGGAAAPYRCVASAGTSLPTANDGLAPTTLILGVGNLLVGDEGVGVHAARLLAEETWPAHVAVLDGGTGGFHLLEHFERYPRLILVDATRDGSPAGTVRSFRAAAPADCPPALGAHDIGLRDLFAAAALLGHWPELHIVTVAVERLIPMELSLSAAVAAALPEVRARVRELVGA